MTVPMLVDQRLLAKVVQQLARIANRDVVLEFSACHAGGHAFDRELGAVAFDANAHHPLLLGIQVALLEMNAGILRFPGRQIDQVFALDFLAHILLSVNQTVNPPWRTKDAVRSRVRPQPWKAWTTPSPEFPEKACMTRKF